MLTYLKMNENSYLLVALQEQSGDHLRAILCTKYHYNASNALVFNVVNRPKYIIIISRASPMK